MIDPGNRAVLDAVDLFAERLRHSGEPEPKWSVLLRIQLAAQAAVIAALETRIAAPEGHSKPPIGMPCIA